MNRALFITRDDDLGVTVTEVRFIEQDAENLYCEIPDDFQPVLSFITEKKGKEVLRVGFMNGESLPDAIGMTWETIPTEGLLRVTLHDVDVTYDPGHGLFFPECIGEPVLTLYDAISPERFMELRKAEQRDKEAVLVAEAIAEAGENGPKTEDTGETTEEEYRAVMEKLEETRKEAARLADKAREATE